MPENKKPWLLWLLSILSGILLALAWPPLPCNFIIFVAFVPWLAMQDHLEAHYRHPTFLFVFLSFVTFLIWNVLTTWWVSLATVSGAMAAFVLNALLMTLPVFFYQRVRKYAGRLLGYVALICFWLCLEYMQLNWDAPWPWLNIGNVFATSRHWIQWYEYTGAMGGTLWVWVINILIYEALRLYSLRQHKTRRHWLLSAAALFLIIIPIGISYLLLPPPVHFKSPENIVVVQPNVDPYKEKFDERTYEAQMQTLIRLSEQKIDSHTVLVIWPETALPEEINERALYASPSIVIIKNFLRHHPSISLITGATTYYIYPEGEKASPTARRLSYGQGYYDVFNTALLLDTSQRVYIYHKSKLVPGVEKMPYPQYLGFLNALAIDEGGTTGSLGSSDSAVIFPVSHRLRVAPVICYESAFGEYVAKFIRKGANLIAIITNDGWWGNTAGYRQALEYSALRAIETRCFIARSANTGVSAFIEPNGDVLQKLKFWTAGAIKSPFVIDNQSTFYVCHGDYIARIALWMAIPFILIALLGGLKMW